MTIIRAPRIQREFTILANSVCLDKRLTMRALGVLVRLLCRPDNWRTNSDGLAAEFGCGRDAVRGALQELQQAGYIRLQRTQNASGHWSSAWTVFDEPQTDAATTGAGETDAATTGAGKTDAGKTGAGKTDAGKTGAGETDAGKPGPITRTDETRTDVTRTDVAKRERATPAPKATPKTTKLNAAALAQLGIPIEDAEAWLATRKEKRLPLTPRAWELTTKDGASVGLTPGQTVEACIRRGWAAFRADWWQRDNTQRTTTSHAISERDASRKRFVDQLYGRNPHGHAQQGDTFDLDLGDIIDVTPAPHDRN